MDPESTARLWNALLSVHHCISKDFVEKLQHATSISDDDIQPIMDAFGVLRDVQFKVGADVLALATKALDDLRRNLLEFVDTTNNQISARDSGDGEQQQRLAAQMDQQYNRMVREFESTVQQLKPVAELSMRVAPKPELSFPSLAFVGGAMTVNSPQTTTITSTIVDSPGAIANVAQHMNAVTSSVTQQMRELQGQDEIRDLITELAQRIAALDPSVQPEKTKGMADDLKVLSDEVARPQPRPKWYELSLEGIKEAAEAIGAIGKPVLETVTKLLPLLVP
jgi:hypothetical protein